MAAVPMTNFIIVFALSLLAGIVIVSFIFYKTGKARLIHPYAMVIGLFVVFMVLELATRETLFFIPLAVTVIAANIIFWGSFAGFFSKKTDQKSSVEPALAVGVSGSSGLFKRMSGTSPPLNRKLFYFLIIFITVMMIAVSVFTIMIRPTKYEKLWSRAETLITEGKYQAAITQADKAIADDPSKPDGFIQRGWALTLLGQYQEALKSLETAAGLGRDYMGYTLLAHSQNVLGQSGQARTIIDKTIDNGGNYPEAFINRAIIDLYLKDNKEALLDINAAIKADPESSGAQAVKAWTEDASGNFSSALEDSNKALKINPQRTLALITRAWAYSGLGNQDKAIADAGRAIELEKSYAESLKDLGPIYIELNQAYNELSKGMAYYLLGLPQEKSGKTAEAVSAYQVALTQNPKLELARQRLNALSVK